MSSIIEDDLRLPEFKGVKLEELERRADGKIVRKDRFERGVRDLSTILFGARHEYEIPEVVEKVRRLHNDAEEMADDIGDNLWNRLQQGILYD